MHKDANGRNLISLTLGPVFFCAAIYFLLGRIVIVYQGEDVSRLRPRNYAIVFVSCDIVALILQSVGGAITSASDDDPSQRDTGVNIMIAGLAFQVAALTMFISLALEFAYRIYRRLHTYQGSIREEREDKYEKLRANKWWKVFLLGMSVTLLRLD